MRRIDSESWSNAFGIHNSLYNTLAAVDRWWLWTPTTRKWKFMLRNVYKTVGNKAVGRNLLEVE